MASSTATTSSTASGGDQLEALPKACTFTKLTKPVDGGPSACYSDHWCHANHNWCKAHNGDRTLEHGAPGCSDPASGGETGTLCDPSKVTSEYCAQVCWTMSRYTLSGVSAMSGVPGSACYCGDELNDAGTVQPAASCSQPCAGDAKETCGAPDPSWFVNVGQLQPPGCEGLSVEEEGALSMDLVFSAAIVYLLAMSVYNKKILKRRGWEVVPHATHFKQIVELVQDGVIFTRSKVSGGRAGGGGGGRRDQALPTERTSLIGVDARQGSIHQATAATGSVEGSAAKSAKSKSGKRKKEKKERKETRASSRQKAAGKAEGGGGPAEPQQEQQQEQQQRQLQLQEESRTSAGLHPSQAKIKVVTL